MARVRAVAARAVLLLALVLLAGCGNLGPNDKPAPRPIPTPTAKANTRPGGSGVVGLYVQPDDGRGPILDEINRARRSITLEVYLLSDEATIAALEQARRRGVSVRVILEQEPFGGAGNQPEVFDRLGRAGIDVRWDNPAFRYTHIKTFVIDGRTALVMNQNLTYSSFTGNREFDVVTTWPDQVAQAAAIFEADWNRSAEPPDGPLVVSPTTSRQELLGLIGSARRTLDVYAEVVRDREVMDAFEAAVRRGVTVRLVMSGSPEGTDDDAEERAGVQVRLARGGLYIHAKMMLVDGVRAFVGSQNFTATSLDQNRELGIVLRDRASLLRLAKTFATDFAEGTVEGGR